MLLILKKQLIRFSEIGGIFSLWIGIIFGVFLGLIILDDMTINKEAKYPREVKTTSRTAINLRRCPVPDTKACPVIMEIKPQSQVIAYEDTNRIYYKDGEPKIWRKVSYLNNIGWVRDDYLVWD